MSYRSDERVAVAGEAGFIGSHVVEALRGGLERTIACHRKNRTAARLAA